MLSKCVEFKKAVPVWAKKFENEMNISLLFEADVKGEAVLRIAASSCYQIFLDGELVFMGPARAGHGYYRVDEVRLSADNVGARLSIIAAGYNNNGFQYVDEPAFLCGELEQNGKIVAATGTDCGFRVRHYNERTQKCQRFSFQRNFAEHYDLTRESPEPISELYKAEGNIHFIERGIPYYTNDFEPAKCIIAEGTASVGELKNPFMDRSIVNIGSQLKGFPREELEVCTAWEAQKLVYNVSSTERKPGNSVRLPENGFATLEMEKNLCGLISFTITVDKPATVYAMFDEICGENGDVNFLRLTTSSVVMWKLNPGTYNLLSFEPYVYKFIRLAVIGSGAVIEKAGLRRVGFYRPRVTVKTDNPKIKAVFEAALETFRQNTYDVYMDCASRERAGWLCDSFFTSRVEYALTGKTQVERNFLENFLLPESFRCLPEGMLPMCYPSDHYDGVYIPNWAMWYVVELEEYLRRSGDRELIDRAKDRVYALLGFLKKYENNDGLLEKLDSWVFIEWSRSNDLVQDVSFPSNMLYVKVKRCIARLYNDMPLLDEADRLAKIIKEKSYNGKFFCDNLIYKDGVPVPSGECTESCQYYAFHTGVAAPEEYPELWNTLLTDFGPARKQNNKYPEIAFANAFIGNYLRLDLLDMFGYNKEILDNMEGYFYYMAEKTGTLWENDGDYASCSHGFASHVIYWLKNLGMLEI